MSTTTLAPTFAPMAVRTASDMLDDAIGCIEVHDRHFPSESPNDLHYAVMLLKRVRAMTLDADAERNCGGGGGH